MRIAVHDYAGHPFQLELSRELAARGHDVLHLYCDSLIGPRGAVAPAGGDPPSLRIEGVGIGRTFSTYSPARRLFDEVAYGRVAAQRLRAFGARVVLSANTPLLSQQRLMAEARRSRRRFVFWWQDSYGVGVNAVARRRSSTLASVVAWPVVALERRLLSRSDRVVAISDALRSQALQWGIRADRVDVVPNWAPLDEIVPGPSENRWKTGQGLAGAPLVVYAGTLGLKHDPTLLAELASALRPSGARVAVISEGPGRKRLEELKRSALAPENLVLLDYQPAEVLGQVLAAADVLVAVLEADAGTFSVPSKVLSYLCAGRPVVASIPRQNLAAEVLEESDAGICLEPGDRNGFVAAVTSLLDDVDERARLGSNGRRWAERHFDRTAIAERFERVLAGPRPPGATGPTHVVARTVRRIWGHPENRGRRGRAVARYVAWQAWQRTVRRPWTVPLVPGRRIRCHPHSSAAAVLYYGLPDPMEMRFLLDYLGAGDVFVDVGANHGVYTLLATSVPGVQVIAVEPSTRAFARLEENLDLNHLDGRVSTVRVAAGRSQGDARLSTGRDAMNSLVDGSGPSEPVKVATVDALVAEHARGRVAAVKVDVEGMELDVLAGSARTIARDRPALVVEVNDPGHLREFAARNGYACVHYDPSRRTIESADVESCEGGNALLVADVDETVHRLRRRP